MNPPPPTNSAVATLGILSAFRSVVVPVSERSPAGNVVDKYGSGNPVIRWMTDRFLAELDGLVRDASPDSLLDVGCGEGIVTERMAQYVGDGGVTGIDREAGNLQPHWNQRSSISFQVGDACALDFADDSFGMVSMIEMLQLIPDHRAALAESARVGRDWLLVTTPVEPLWRAMNVARGAYVRDRGNTPGHVHHFSFKAIQQELAEHGDVVAARRVLPWAQVLLRLS